MSSSKPTVRQMSWVSLIPLLFLTSVFFIIYSLIVSSFEYAFMLTALSILIILIFLRYGVSHNHRKGIFLYKKENYMSAIQEFEKSYNFFSKHAWVDKYRAIVLLSPNRASYKEMALLNIAFCHTQSGNGALAKKYYEKTLKLFPNSGMAKTSLKFIHSVENQGDKRD
ncbi:MAG: hypothetical protein FWF88_06505 [Peptococcaceae bacterium]|jgi:tetratricopeptide (TPR) repeat protein|nr:hypothetical protein [Peptococcaceae bacterium]